nr:sulfite exporter TauE/SafE family protein [Conexibacter arvalis]
MFVPALTIFAGLGHVEAEATSLLAIVPVALVGSWRQRRYGNLRLEDAAVMGGLSVAGAVGGVALANVLPERALKIGFALLMLNLARQLVQRGLRDRRARLESPA